MAGSDEETMADNSMYVNKSQKVIISDLLFYIWNRLKSDPKDDIVHACVSFYANKDDYVRQEKEKFFASISETCTQRRGEKEEKTRKDIDDIIKFMLDRDSKNLFIPIVVSIDMNNLRKWKMGQLGYLAFLASNFDISAVYGRIELCFRYGAPVGLCYHRGLYSFKISIYAI